MRFELVQVRADPVRQRIERIERVEFCGCEQHARNVRACIAVIVGVDHHGTD